ncbi:glycoside hydrolase family 108 protein [Pleionea sp. CnH1-48]|uniref:glycoside hydrolase family 108 protein n=1 Tax=Pleionea sp. CnH1-48 TaxID=2954494 RepID=UPI0020970F01|nr:glycosyl hydrolase 108 family protein [Pleionea sp. CnH1-48]MCO7226197.1 hypothetical protein [Pleionea sp. CnH1-48]
MAEFQACYEKTLLNEGGYQLHHVAHDKGGLTYAGISQRYHPSWEGWKLIGSKANAEQLTPLVKQFYRDNFWQSIKGDDIHSQKVAETLYDFAVNAGVRTAIKLMQIVVGATPDGIVGPKTIAAINHIEPDMFLSNYALAKVHRYVEICNRDKTQSKFLLGWLNRTLGV